MLHLGRNIFSLVLSRVLSGVILFLIYTRLVQYLGPEQTGHFGLIGFYLTVFGFFVDFGMSHLVIKKMSEDSEHAGKYLTNYFLIQTGLALFFMFLMDVIVWFADYPASVKVALYVASLGLLLSSVSLPFRAVIVAMQKLTINAQVNFYNSFINAGMMVMAIYFNKSVLFLAFISVIVGLFDLIIYAWVVNRRFTKFTFDFDKTFIKQLFLWNTPFMLLTLFAAYNRIDGLLLPYFVNFEQTGYYSAAYKFWDILAFFPGVLGITLYPFFAHAISKNLIDQVRIGLQTYTRYMIAIAVPMAVGVFLLAEELTLNFFGREFIQASDPLWLLVLAVSVVFIYTPVNSLVISQLTRNATKITGFTFVVNVLLNLLLIPKFGIVASAAITVLSELIQTVGYTYIVKKKIVNFEFFKSFAKPLIAAGFMAAFILAFKNHNVWFVIALSGIIYGLGLLVLKFFRRSDWELLKAAINIKREVSTEATLTDV
ncbi:MAG TPA: flippase [Verrucomicrobiae bacterium]|nr:flippase [Verrucomicrobiae bacterium]